MPSDKKNTASGGNLSEASPMIGFDDIPANITAKWQEAANLLAEALKVPVALVMRTENDFMEVAVSSNTAENPYHPGDKEHWEGLYCQTVIQKQEKLVVANALKDPQWDHNPDIKLGMVACMGLPVNFPDGRPYGTICVLDRKEHFFTDTETQALQFFRDTIEADLLALQNETELRKRETFIRAIVDNLPIGITVNAMDADARPEYMNDLFPKFYRTTREALTSVEAFWQKVYPDPAVREKVRARIEADCASGDTERMYWPELPITREGEETTFVSARNAPIPGSRQMISLVWDVTEQKKDREELARQFHMLEVAGRMANFGGWIVDLSTKACTWSDIVFDIHEMPHGSAPPVEEGINFYAPEWRERISNVFTACANEGKPYDEEMQIITRTGKRVWVRTVGEAVRDEEGKITHVHGAFQDISPRKRDEQNIHHLNQVLRAIRDINQRITHETDSEHLLRQSCEILIATRGYRSAWAASCNADGETKAVAEAGIGEDFAPVREALEQNHWPECCHLAQASPTGVAPIFNTDSNCTHCPLSRAYRGTAALAGRLRHDDQDYGVLVVALPEGVAESDEERTLFRELAQDLGFALHALDSRRKLKRSEEQLRQAQKMEAVGRLAGGVAHDFNNLIMGILGYTELAADQLPPEHPVREDLNQITRNAHRSADLTRQLLAFARKQTIAPKCLNLNDTIASMLKLLQRLLGEDIDILWKPAKKMTPVIMDPTQVDQMLANLCINARDAIKGVGQLTIETESTFISEEYCEQNPEAVPGSYIMLAITDSGEGMSAETKAHIFEPFFTTKKMGYGTGLGLSTVYGIVKQNNGFINVYSELGKGTTFKIYIPMARSPEPETTADHAETAEQPRGTETILLVEDEASIRITIKKYLESLGYTVLEAAMPERALQIAASHQGPIPLLITDVILPQMNGRELADQLTDARNDMRTLFMSGYTANVIVHRGILDEGADFLQKPVTMAALSAKVRAMLDQ